MHLFTPLDLMKGILSPLKTENRFRTPDSPARALAVINEIQPTDALTFGGGAPPLVDITRLGPGRFRAQAKVMGMAMMTLEMHLTVEPDGTGSLIREHIAISSMAPGTAAFADSVHSIFTSLELGYRNAARRVPVR